MPKACHFQVYQSTSIPSARKLPSLVSSDRHKCSNTHAVWSSKRMLLLAHAESLPSMRTTAPMDAKAQSCPAPSREGKSAGEQGQGLD